MKVYVCFFTVDQHNSSLSFHVPPHTALTKGGVINNFNKNIDLMMAFVVIAM